MRCSDIYPTESTFLAGIQLTACIHRPYYCIVHVYVVNHFFVNMWIFFFWVEANLKIFLVVCLYLYCCWRINDQSGIWIQIACLTPPYQHDCSKPGPEFSTPYFVVCLFCVQCIHMSDGCSLC